MKKKLLYFCLCLLTVACAAEKQEKADTTSALQITTSGIATRVAINGDQFEAGDNISLSLYDLEDNLYNVGNGENWFWYKYNGAEWNNETEWKGEPLLTEQYVRVYAVYPTTDSDLLKNGQRVSINPQNNVQQEYLLAVSDGTNNSRKPVVNLQFHYMLSLVTVNLTKGVNEEIHVDKVALKNRNNSTAIQTSGHLDVKTGTIATLSSSSSNVSIVKTVDKSLSAAALVSTQFLVIPTKTSDGVALSVTIGGKEYEVSVPSTTWEKGKKYTYNVTVNTASENALSISEAIITPRDNTDMETLNADFQYLSIGGTIGKPVDLGLSVKWADHNVGASSESEVGGRYMWGDPTGTATSATYSQPNLKEISGTKYDIATVQWGSQWRLPTYDEIKELVDNTSYVWTSRNGILGGLFTSKKSGYTDKSIFIPYYGSYWTDTGIKNGDVWSGTLSSYQSDYARFLNFDEEKAYSGYITTVSRKTPVRPVCK